MECAERHGHLLQLLGASALPWNEPRPVLFEQAWVAALADYDEFVADRTRRWVVDGRGDGRGAAGEKNEVESDAPRQGWHQAQLAETEANGVPLAIVVAGANRNDFKFRRVETLEDVVIARPKLDLRRAPGALPSTKATTTMRCVSLAGTPTRFTAHIRRRGEEARAAKKTGGFKARRWVVEHTHRLDQPISEGFLICWEKRPDTYLAMLHSRLPVLITWKACALHLE